MDPLGSLSPAELQNLRKADEHIIMAVEAHKRIVEDLHYVFEEPALSELPKKVRILVGIQLRIFCSGSCHIVLGVCMGLSYSGAPGTLI